LYSVFYYIDILYYTGLPNTSPNNAHLGTRVELLRGVGMFLACLGVRNGSKFVIVIIMGVVFIAVIVVVDFSKFVIVIVIIMGVVFIAVVVVVIFSKVVFVIVHSGCGDVLLVVVVVFVIIFVDCSRFCSVLVVFILLSVILFELYVEDTAFFYIA